MISQTDSKISYWSVRHAASLKLFTAAAGLSRVG